MKPKLIDQRLITRFKIKMNELKLQKLEKNNKINYFNYIGLIIIVLGILFLYYRLKKNPELKNDKLQKELEFQKTLQDYYLGLETSKIKKQNKIIENNNKLYNNLYGTYQNEFRDFKPLS